VPAGQPALQAGLGNVGALHHELRSSASQYNSAAVTAQNNLNQPTQTAPPPSAVPAAGLPSVNETVAVSNASPLLGTESSASSQMLAGAATASLAAPALKAQKMASLPSHLLALSTISNSHQELALDSAGSLFRSEDAGVTWQTVPAQWTGHAVKLRLAPQPIMHAMAKSADSATATAKLPPAAANFELTNDVGEVWVSADGKSWQRK
jgi:hypothetical protein